MKKMKQNKKKGILTTWAGSSAVCSLTRVDLKLGKKYWTPNGKSRVDSQLGIKKVGP